MRTFDPLLEGHDGSLWVGTNGKGLSRMKDSTLTTYGTAERIARQLRDIDH